MKLSDGTILMHDGAPYDPVKAHEYYIKNRHLKGRQKSSGRSTTVGLNKANYTVGLKNGKTVTLTQKQLVEQQVYAEKRITNIKNRLNELTTKIKKMLKEAEQKKESVNKKPTAADKREASKESKQYRQKHKQELANKAKKARDKTPSKKTLTSKDSVVELKSKITEIKGQLKAAIEIQRSLTTAKKIS